MRQYVRDHIKNVFEENAQNTPDFMGTSSAQFRQCRKDGSQRKSCHVEFCLIIVFISTFNLY